MPYPEDYLHDYEELVLDLHPHWWFLAKSCAVLVVAVAIGAAVLSSGWGGSPVKILMALLILGALGWFVERYLRWVSTHFVLTSDRVIYRSGILAKRGVEIPLESINAIHFEQRIFERMLGLGDLTIDSASVLGVSKFDDINHPDRVQNEIYGQMEANDRRRFSGARPGEQAATAEPAGPAPIPVHEQLDKLADLRDRGVITEDEFQAKKTELLGRM